MIAVSDIKRMTVSERLQAMELLWTSLASTPEVVPSPDWHGAVLEDRLAKVERGEGEFLTMSQVKARLRQPKS